MTRIMMDPGLTVSMMTKLKVVLATLFGTFGLFAQALYYLIITGQPFHSHLSLLTKLATRGYRQSTFLALSILLVDEVIPALLFVACVITLPIPSRILASITNTKPQSKSKSKSPRQKRRHASFPPLELLSPHPVTSESVATDSTYPS